MAGKPNLSRQGGSFGSYVQITGPEMAKVLAGPQGPVVTHLLHVGERAKQGMIRRAPVYRLPPQGPPRKRAPGTLRDSHVKRLAKDGAGVVVLVGSDDPVSLLVVKGTSPHPIVARRKPFLVFYWKKVGAVVWRKRVNHPGTHPNSYMIDAVREAVTHQG